MNTKSKIQNLNDLKNAIGAEKVAQIVSRKSIGGNNSNILGYEARLFCCEFCKANGLLLSEDNDTPTYRLTRARRNYYSQVCIDLIRQSEQGGTPDYGTVTAEAAGNNDDETPNEGTDEWAAAEVTGNGSDGTEEGNVADGGADSDGSGESESETDGESENGGGNGESESESEGESDGNGDGESDGDESESESGSENGSESGDESEGGESESEGESEAEGNESDSESEAEQQPNQKPEQNDDENSDESESDDEQPAEQQQPADDNVDRRPPKRRKNPKALEWREQIENNIRLRNSVYVFGPAGCGKSYEAKKIAERLGYKFYQTSCVTAEHKIEGYGDAMGVFRSTAFYKAFTTGGVFLLDEMDASIPDVLTILNQALANGAYDFPAPKGNKKMHPDFRVIATGNTTGAGATVDYNSRQKLDAATVNRFCYVKARYLREVELECTKGDDKNAPINEDLVTFARLIRKAAKECGIANFCMSYRNIKQIASMEGTDSLPNIMFQAVTKGMPSDDIIALVENMGPTSCQPKGVQEYIKALKKVAAEQDSDED